jgi:dTDP-glucose 4,6-dehydratase
VRAPHRLLVTGGCGFIGSAFIRQLLRRPDFTGDIVNLDKLTYAGNPKSVIGLVPEQRHHLVQGDICDRGLVLRLLDEHRIDTLVHFAAESHVDRSIEGPSPFVTTNVLGTMELLEAVRQRPSVHFHHISTDEVYGSLGPAGLFTENTAYQPSSPYSASKAGSDHLVRAWAHTFGLSVTLSNCSNNYGPFQFPEKLIPLMILNLLEGRPLPVYGQGTNVRDWLFVDDHVEAIWAIVTRGTAGRTYNIGGNAERRNLEVVHKLIEIVAKLTGKSAASLTDSIQFVKDRPGHDLRYAIDATRIKTELGWEPRHDFASGLEATVAWYLEQRDWVDAVRDGSYRQWLQTNYAQRDK